MKKLVSIVLILALVFCFASCGSDTKEKAEDVTVKGAEQTIGNFTVFVPEGYTATDGNITGSDKNDPDPNSCYIQPDPPSMYDYYTILILSEDDALGNIEMTKAANSSSESVKDLKEIEYKIGDVTWKGITYLYATALNGEVPCGAYYATIGDTVYYAMINGHAIDSAEVAAVLGSLK